MQMARHSPLFSSNCRHPAVSLVEALPRESAANSENPPTFPCRHPRSQISPIPSPCSTWELNHSLSGKTMQPSKVNITSPPPLPKPKESLAGDYSFTGTYDGLELPPSLPQTPQATLSSSRAVFLSPPFPCYLALFHNSLKIQTTGTSALPFYGQHSFSHTTRYTGKYTGTPPSNSTHTLPSQG